MNEREGVAEVRRTTGVIRRLWDGQRDANAFAILGEMDVEESESEKEGDSDGEEEEVREYRGTSGGGEGQGRERDAEAAKDVLHGDGSRCEGLSGVESVHRQTPRLWSEHG